MKIRAVVDQIEVGKALLLLSSDQRQVIWPVDYLPKEIKEGDIIYFDVNIDHEETRDKKEQARQRIAEMVKRTQEMERQKAKDSE